MDEAPLKQLLQAAGLPITDLTPERLRDFLVAYRTSEVVGVAGIEPYGEVGLLRSVAVQDKLRGSKLGKRLVEAVEMRAGRMGIVHIYLLTTTAAGFFAGLGYRQLARESAPAAIRATAQFSELCPASSVFMIKTINWGNHVENL